MSSKTKESRESFLENLYQELSRKVSRAESKKITEFARHYYSMFPLEELQEKRFDDLYGAVLSCWHFVQSRPDTQPKIRVFNPHLEEHGWQARHTVIEILANDMPFLVDSVRMEINRRLITIHTIQSIIFQVKRDDKQHLLEMKSMLDEKNMLPDYHPEALIYLEIDRHSDTHLLEDIAIDLREILAEVKEAVTDFHAIVSKVDGIITDLEKNAPPLLPEEIAETIEFLKWMKADHFTFLGYDESEVVVKSGNKSIKRKINSGLGVLAGTKSSYIESVISAERIKYLPVPQLITFTKLPVRSRIHRPAYPDYIILKVFDEKGGVVGEKRILGLFTSPVYTQSPRTIPIIRHKVQSVIQRSHYTSGSHNWKELIQILEVFPRDELFQISSGELLVVTMAISQIQERRRIRVFIRRSSYGNFFTSIVFAPRDIYSTDLRKKIQAILSESLQSKDAEFTTYFSESILARTYFVLRVDPEASIDYDPNDIEFRVIEAARSWFDKLSDALQDAVGEEQASRLSHKYMFGFPLSYQENFSPNIAVVDIEHIENLTEEQPIDMCFYQPLEQDDGDLHFKLFHRHQSVSLSDIMPIFEHFGLRVLAEHPYRVACHQGHCAWIHEFSLRDPSEEIDIKKIKGIFKEAFLKIWQHKVENDSFNRLLVKAYLPWYEIAILRVFARYNRQLSFGFSQSYIAETLYQHAEITQLLVKLFKQRFDPDIFSTLEDRQLAIDTIKDEILKKIDVVSSLDEDRILRRFLELMLATIRTNYYQMSHDAEQFYLAFKFNPQKIAHIPLPKPLFEIYFYSYEVEGVHLRSGKVARGGLRWSDRPEDFRTEVLGLVKAQQVKNAVIVPMGAKGGFVIKNPLENATRDEVLQQGISCYKQFIRGLLDITDNLIEHKISPPKRVIRWDEDDPYLVVAADKGTASFSDYANAVSKEYNFWLGDAFASGGSAGYDHKKMGITAKGGWVSVERHFREMNRSRDQEFSVIGIGDMSGDVFGNGMLLSKNILLLAAFNHKFIFIDPNPNAKVSFIERERLFNLTRSEWSDYDSSLISEGGGIFNRSLKSIAISPAMQERFGITEKQLTPSELINALLRAPVDLIWNGGIGTFVKATSEFHEEVGDKVNDVLRVDATKLRCKVIGEGGNLGLTQLARVEFALQGGRVNTDFVDNAGGVNCSDHEVNIKILLDKMVASEDLTEKQRNQLLAKMEEEVAELVLHDNYRQTEALSLAEIQAEKQLFEYQRFIHSLEQAGKLDRALEFLPTDDIIAERRAKRMGLTRPELSVLISYAKLDLKNNLLICEELTANAYLCREAFHAFPKTLVDKYPEQIFSHRLIREIVATQLANGLINRMGVNYIPRMLQATGRSVFEICLAYTAVNHIFSADKYWKAIESFDYKISAESQYRMMLRLMRLLRRASRWLLRNRRREFNLDQIINDFCQAINEIQPKLPELMQGPRLENWKDLYQRYQSEGIDDELCCFMSSCDSLYSILSIVDINQNLDISLMDIVKLYFNIGEKLNLYEFEKLITALDVENQWQALARESFRDDVEWQQRALTERILKQKKPHQNLDVVISQWLKKHESLIKRWKQLLNDFANAEKKDFAMGTVAVRGLLDLAQAL